MSIVTISRGLFSSGQALAERAAEILGYRSMSRELLMEAATRYEIPEAKLTELMETPPEVTPIKPELLRLYRVVMQAAMCEVVQGGKIVYHGHGGQEFLPGIHHVLKVRLLAPLPSTTPSFSASSSSCSDRNRSSTTPRSSCSTPA